MALTDPVSQRRGTSAVVVADTSSTTSPCASSYAIAEVDVSLEILGYRDLIIGQKVTIANLEWRLEECERKLRVVTRHRDDMQRSATWRLGRLIVGLLWPVRKLRAVLSPPRVRRPS